MRTLIIAEIGQAHDGSLGLVHAYIDAVADAGVDAIKFQIHFADEETTLDDSFRPGAETFDGSRFDYWKRIEFSEAQWRIIAGHVRDRQCEFFASCFSNRAYSLADSLGCRWAKISSGELVNRDWPEDAIRSKDKIFISTGMSDFLEIDNAIREFASQKRKLVLMQCASIYPTPLEDVGLNVCEEFRRRYGVQVGLSDHSGTPHPAIAAIAEGVDAVEVHVIFDKKVNTPDTTSSLDMGELKLVADFRDAYQKFRTNPVDKGKVLEETVDTRSRFTKSLALRRSLNAGEIIEIDNLILKKPGTGLPGHHKMQIIGKRTRLPVSSKRLLRWDDIDQDV